MYYCTNTQSSYTMSKIQEIKGLAQTNIKLIKDSMDVSQKLLLDLVKLYPAGMSMYNNFMGEADYIADFEHFSP